MGEEVTLGGEGELTGKRGDKNKKKGFNGALNDKSTTLVTPPPLYIALVIPLSKPLSYFYP